MDQNIIEYNVYSAIGTALTLRLPAAHRTDVKALSKPVAKFGSRAAEHADVGRRLQAALATVERVKLAIKAEAEAAAEADRPVEAKKLIKRQRAAEDAAAEIRVEHDAIEHALRQSYARVVEAVQHNAPALRAEAITNVDSDMLSLATILARLRDVLADLEEHAGVLGMVDTLDQSTTPTLRKSPAGGRATAHVSAAIGSLVLSIGEVSDTLDIARGAIKAEPDVVVPMPDEDTADATPAGEFAIVATPDTDADDE